MQTLKIKYMTEEQLRRFTSTFKTWYQSGGKRKKNRGRYWILFLTLRWTGARLGEVRMINELEDIDYENGEIRLITLKRKVKCYRTVPIPKSLVSEIARFLIRYPEFRGNLFRVDPGNVRRVFYRIGEMSGVPKELSHPHILRHTRALELLKKGVPVSAVQDILGHSSLNTTAIYLKFSAVEIKRILMERGAI